MNFRKITHKERLCIEEALAEFGKLDLQGGSREEKDGKIIYHLGFYHAHLNSSSGEIKKVGRILKDYLGADEIWIDGSRIA